MLQIGVALSALGMMLAVLGLFPGITGVASGQGIGIVQFAAILSGFSLLDLGAFLYAKFSIFPGRSSNLAQQVGMRITMTGLVLAGMAGFADFLGFGSHLPQPSAPAFFGSVQAALVLLCLIGSSIGVLVYALAGTPPDAEDEDSIADS